MGKRRISYISIFVLLAALGGFISNITEEVINNSRTIGFGIGVPVKGLKFYPTIDCQYYGNNLSVGIWRFGIGLRLYTN